VITAQGVEDRTCSIQVVVEHEGEIILESFTAQRRPCPGGYSIGHPRLTAGTLGGIACVGSDWGYILSNNHVLAASNSGAVGDAIYQPGVSDGGGPTDTIGYLNRWVPVNVSGGNNEVDCAFAKAREPWDQNGTRHVEGIGTPTAVADATTGQAVRKSGKATEVTTGMILSNNATVRLPYAGGQAIFVNQLQYSRMTQGGDSGALVWDQNNLSVVGLHFAGSSSASYGNKIKRVLELIGQTYTVLDAQGNRIHFPQVDVSLIDQP
jgi:V8-like Glu-specific endopeptidase